jgi:hypothetical protein
MAPQNTTLVDWTVGRCNRLMRPLVTRIQKLRVLKEEKEVSKRTIIVVSAGLNANKGQDLDSSEDSSGETRVKSARENDPDWMSVPKKKKAPKAYSSRTGSARNAATEIGVRTPARSKSQANLRPGELTIPTPYLTRNDANKSEADHTTHDPEPGMTSNRINRGRFEKSTSGMHEYRKKAYFVEGEDEEGVAWNVTKTFLDILAATNTSVDPVEQKLSSPSRGPRSLWATCCGKFGAMIGEVEADPDPEEDGLLDAGAEYYAMAEDLELPERKPGGRLQLRLIVRAHATHVMAGAVEEGLIPARVLKQHLPHMLRPTVDSTQPASAIEGEFLLSKSHALVTPNTSVSCPSKHRNHFYTHVLNSAMSQYAYVSDDLRLAFSYRQLTLIVCRPDIPVEWMASRRMMPLWRNVFRTLLDSKSSQDVQDAYKLLRHTVALAVGLEPSSSAADKVLSEIPADFVHKSVTCPKCPRAQFGTFLVDTSPAFERPASDLKLSKIQLIGALSNTLSSMSTLFSSFSIAHNEDPVKLPNVNAQVVLSVLNLLALDIAKHHATSNEVSFGYTRNSAVADVKHTKVTARRAVSILTAAILPQIAGCQLSTGLGYVSVNHLVRLMKMLDSETRNNSADSTTIVDCLPELVCSIARSTSQVLKADNFDTLRNLVRSLATPNVPGQKISPSTALFLRQLASSSAHHFAEISRDSAHYSLIDEIEKEIGLSEHFDVSKTPFRSSTKVRPGPRGFKWEEGICEWVLATPKPSKSDADGPKKIAQVLNIFDQAQAVPFEEEYSSEDELPGLWDTEVGSNVTSLSEFITSSPIGGDLPINFSKNKFSIPKERQESEHVKNIEVAHMKPPILKRSSSVDPNTSDDELSFHSFQSRKRPSSSNLHSSSSGPAKLQSRSKLARNERKDDSEDELGFA